MNDMKATWRQQATRISSVLDALGDDLDPEIAEEVRYFLGHREFGVAIEGLRGHIELAQLVLPDAARRTMDALVEDLQNGDE